MNALDDPYSCYYTADEYQTLMESTSGSYEGIGVVVSQNVQTKIITVVRPFEGCPGAEAGMLPGDILIEVAGNDVSGIDVSTVVSWIKERTVLQLIYAYIVSQKISIMILLLSEEKLKSRQLHMRC